MALAEYEKGNGQKVVSCRQIMLLLGSLDTLSSDFLNVLKTGKERGQEGGHVCPLSYTLEKKINGFARFTKMSRSRKFLPKFC